VNAAGSSQTPTVSVTNSIYFRPDSGYSYAVAFQATSDATAKRNVETVANALHIVSQLRGVDFTWKENGLKSSGVIAQEAEEIVPHLVHTNATTGMKSFNYDGLIGVLIEAVKELKAEVDALKNR
jgi:hypothetical protein